MTIVGREGICLEMARKTNVENRDGSCANHFLPIHWHVSSAFHYMSLTVKAVLYFWVWQEVE